MSIPETTLVLRVGVAVEGMLAVVLLSALFDPEGPPPVLVSGFIIFCMVMFGLMCRVTMEALAND